MRQNWVLDPLQDALFIIVAPLIALALALVVFKRYGAAEATTIIVTAHIVMTVAHHLPTFIRVYGDVDLFRRFKWHFLMGPVVPVGISVGVLSYLYAHDLPVEYFLYLYIMLVLWDPWHFLRQHYGFMRIYDRPNAAPRELASRMDLALSIAWFAYAMAASSAWLPELLNDLYASTNVPVALSISASTLQSLSSLLGVIAVGVTIVYCGYLVWCRYQGFFVSRAKIALLAITFGVMYLAYVPNAWIQSVAPGWSFKVGFAVIGMVHMTQYLAIVWRYNRGLAGQQDRTRSGIFRSWHARGGLLLGVLYVALCLFYGEIVTTRQSNRLLMSILLAIGFSSTLLHYYFDGFIWKLRHQQNRDALAMGGGADSPGGQSWWGIATQSTPVRMLGRQALYFGVPMLLLTAGALAAWSRPADHYAQHMYRAQSLSQQGLPTAAANEARAAFAAMNREFPMLAKMVELEPTASREAELAFLTYNRSLYANVVLPQLDGAPVNATRAEEHRARVQEAIALLESAVTRGGALGHASRERMTRDDAMAVLASWRRLVQ